MTSASGSSIPMRVTSKSVIRWSRNAGCMASPRGFWARKMPESGIFFPSTSDQKPSILLLLRGLELLTMLDAAIGEHQDFGFFVGHFLAGLGPNDEGLRAIGQIEC